MSMDHDPASDRPRLELRDLVLVRAIADEGSMTAAARRMHLTQSALSHRLRQIEDAYGGEVFDRGGRGMTPTPMGARLVETARRVLADVAEAEADLDSLASGRAGTLRIASECYTAYHWLPPVLSAYREAHPDVDLLVVAEATEDPIPWVLGGRLDVAVVTKTAGYEEAVRAGELVLTPLFEDEMVAVVPEGHAWAERAWIEAEDVSTEHVVLYQNYDRTRRPPRPLPLPAGSAPARVTTVPATTEGVVALVKSGVGVTAMATWAAEGYLAAGGLSAVRMTEAGLWRTWYAVTRSGAPGYVGAFVDRLDALVPAPVSGGDGIAGPAEPASVVR